MFFWGDDCFLGSVLTENGSKAKLGCRGVVEEEEEEGVKERLKGSAECVGVSGAVKLLLLLLLTRDMEMGGRVKEVEEVGGEDCGTEEEDGFMSSLVRLRGRLEIVWMLAGLGGTGGGAEGEEEEKKSTSSKLSVLGLA